MRTTRAFVALATLLTASNAFAKGSDDTTAMDKQAAPFASLNINLITNYAAEAGPGASNSSDIFPPPRWITVGAFTAARYDTNGFPSYADPGPPNRRNNFFAGGPSNALSTATQTIDVSNLSSVIDSSSTRFKLSGYFGGWEYQDDNAVLNVSFLNKKKSVLSMVAIGSVLAAERGSRSGLIRKALSGTIPRNTRFIVVSLVMTRTDGSYNDGYADDLSLILTKSSKKSTASRGTGH